MKLERNVKLNERKAILRVVRYRERTGKKSHIRVRGHKISQKRLLRWFKEGINDHPFVITDSPSRKSFSSCISLTLHIILMTIAIPSSMSIYTSSQPASPKSTLPTVLEYQELDTRCINSGDMPISSLQRILAYAHGPRNILEYREARAIFNDIQAILGHINIAFSNHEVDHWNSAVKEEHITQVRNWMNLASELAINREWNCRNRTIIPTFNMLIDN